MKIFKETDNKDAVHVEVISLKGTYSNAEVCWSEIINLKTTKIAIEVDIWKTI